MSCRTSEGNGKGVKPLPQELFHKNFLDMGSSNQDIDLGKKHWTNTPMMNDFLKPVTGK